MQLVDNVINELRKAIKVMQVCDFSSRVALLFLFTLLVFSFFEISWLFAFLFTLFYATVLGVKIFSMDDFKYVEEQSPILKDELRAVVDNSKAENFIINELRVDVLKKLNELQVSSLMDRKVLTKRISFIGLLSFMVILVGVGDLHFSLVDLVGNVVNDKVDDLVVEAGVREGSKDLVYVDDDLAYGNLNEVMGEGKLAKLGDEELTLELNLVDSQIVLGSSGEVKDREFFPPNFPKEIYTSYDISYNEKVSRENIDVVKTYFEAIMEEA